LGAYNLHSKKNSTAVTRSANNNWSEGYLLEQRFDVVNDSVFYIDYLMSEFFGK
jgi:hypothetical protein